VQAVTPTDVALVQSSFRRIAPTAEQAGALFYARLFELDPTLRELFRGDMRQQGRKLMSMLGTAVSSLERLEMLISIVRAFGARHHRYGVFAEHYATVGAALIWTLQKGLGPEFTPAVANAWSTTYSFLANIMIEAQRGARPAASFQLV
jgi:hemoglobin-like flavoprotein